MHYGWVAQSFRNIYLRASFMLCVRNFWIKEFNIFTLHSKVSALADVTLGGDDLYVLTNYERMSSLEQCISKSHRMVHQKNFGIFLCQ